MRSRSKLIRLQRLFASLVISSIFCIILLSNIILEESNTAHKNQKIFNESPDAPCGRYPTEEDILIDNIVWQNLEMKKGFLKLLNAYLDERKNETIVRINASGKPLNISADMIYCQFWFGEKSRPLVVKATEFLIMWYWGINKKHNHPYLITCPTYGRIPESVSLVVYPCDNAENNLKIINNHPPDGVKKKFGICSKQISYENRNFGFRIIEWIHMLRILGADKIHIYNRYVHPSFFKVLEYMEAQGFVEVWPYLEVRTAKRFTAQKQLLEMNVLNDCFYRIRHLYEFIIILDIDELIMPVMEEDRSWHDIIKRQNIVVSTKDAFTSELVNYPNINAKPVDGVPNYHYMLQHIRRSINSTRKGAGVKSVINPANVVVVHNHYPLFCIKDVITSNNKTVKGCRISSIPKSISQMNHYRDEVKNMFKSTVEDRQILRFKDDLIKAVNETMVATNFRLAEGG